jgi:hypothetical protein
VAEKTDPVKRAIEKAGVAGLDKPKLTPKGPKKAVVVTKVDGKPKIIRFGDPSMGHNYSPEARAAFKARHAKNIARGPSSPAYWADKFLWAGKGGSTKAPPPGQKLVRGKPKG